MFVYNTLFFKNTRTHVVISVFFDTWPELLKKPEGDGRLEPLAETIIWLIYNTGPATSMADMKVSLCHCQPLLHFQLKGV